MAKSDLRSAFRVVPINRMDHDLLGFTWQGKFYYDRCLCMGGSSSCQNFQAASTALQWIAEHKFGCINMVHILDDFFFVRESYEACLDALLQFLQLCRHVGFPIAEEKTFFLEQPWNLLE